MAEWKDTMLETGIDQLLEIVSERKKVSADDIARELSIPKDTIETWAEILTKENIVSTEYDRTGKLIITNRTKNVSEKKKKIEGLKDEVGSEIADIEQNVKEESKIIEEERRSIANFEETLKREYGETVKLESKLKEISLRESELKKMVALIDEQETKIKKDYKTVNDIINTKVKQIKDTEDNLKSYEMQKDRLLKDIEIIKRLSKAISKENPQDMATKIEEIEKDILTIRKQSRTLDKKYSVIRRMMSKI